MTGRNQQIGRWGENLAARWYLEHGFDVVEQNWTVNEGELDLIAIDRDSSTVVFCEVKTRTSSRFGTGAEAVTKTKQRQVRKVAMLWLQQHNERFNNIRFDVASVDGDGDVNLIEGCF